MKNIILGSWRDQVIMSNLLLQVVLLLIHNLSRLQLIFHFINDSNARDLKSGKK